MNETNWHFRRLAETLIISDDSSWIILAMNQFWVCMLKLMMISWANLWRDFNSESTNYSPTHDWSKSVLRWIASASRLPWSRRVMTRCAEVGKRHPDFFLVQIIWFFCPDCIKFQSPSDIYQGSFQGIYKLKIQTK